MLGVKKFLIFPGKYINKIFSKEVIIKELDFHHYCDKDKELLERIKEAQDNIHEITMNIVVWILVLVFTILLMIAFV